MLQNPPAGDWLTWRRGFDYQGFSPLKQITKVKREQSARGVDLDAASGRK